MLLDTHFLCPFSVLLRSVNHFYKDYYLILPFTYRHLFLYTCFIVLPVTESNLSLQIQDQSHSVSTNSQNQKPLPH
jgi:hypothetical protein